MVTHYVLFTRGIEITTYRTYTSMTIIGRPVLPYTTRFGQRSFCSSAPNVWNDLPSKLQKTVTSFYRQCYKLDLKT